MSSDNRNSVTNKLPNRHTSLHSLLYLKMSEEEYVAQCTPGVAGLQGEVEQHIYMTETGKQLFHHSFNSREDKMENLLTSSPSIGDTTENHTSEHTVQSVIMIVIDHFILDLVVLGFFFTLTSSYQCRMEGSC